MQRTCSVLKWLRNCALLHALSLLSATTACVRHQQGHRAQANVAASCSALTDLCAVLQEGADFALRHDREFTLAIGEMRGRSMLLRFR